VRLLHVVPHIDREASGPGYSVPALCDALVARGDEVVLATLAREPIRQSHAFRHEGYPPSRGPARLGMSTSMARGLVDEARTADLVHNHSLWMMPNIYSGEAAAVAGRPFVLSPRGTLNPTALKRSHWRKQLIWRLGQRKVANSATLLHATSDQEYLDIRTAGLTQPVAVIPNGVDVPRPLKRPPRKGLRRLLYLGRLHPIKGLPDLLTAWRMLSTHALGWELRLVGPDSEDHLLKLQQMSASLGLERVVFAGERYGAEKSAEYWDADLYVLPSRTENFGMSIAEALAHGLPVVTTTGTPWEGLRAQHCGWWVPGAPEAIAEALAEAMALPRTQLQAMGGRGRTWMAEAFSWERIAESMQQAYGWIVNGGSTPASVRLA
jgi:glycosyltransferase involved in cell wall biosynthesis